MYGDITQMCVACITKIMVINVNFEYYTGWTTVLIDYSVVCVCMHAYMLSHFICVWLFLTLWTVAFQASLSMGFWTELPCIGELILKAIKGVAWYVSTSVCIVFI